MTLTKEPSDALAAPEAPEQAAPFGSALEQLEGELRWLAARLRLVVLRGRRRRTLGPADEYRGLYVSDEEVDHVLAPAAEQPTDLGEIRRGAAAWRSQLDRRAAATRADGRETPLDRLVRSFELSADERGVLIVALAPHLDRGYEQVFAYANDDVTRKRPSVGLALEALADSRAEALELRSTLEPGATLLRQDLLSIVEESGTAAASILARSLQLDPHIATQLLAEGVAAAIDPRLAGLARLFPARAEHAPAVLEGAVRLARVIEQRPDARVYLGGRWSGEQRGQALAACDRLGLALIRVDSVALRAAPDLDSQLRRLRRDARLLHAALFLDGWDEASEGNTSAGNADAFERSVKQALLGHPLPVILAGRAARPPRRGPELHLLAEVPEPTYEERLTYWEAAIDGPDAAEHADRLAATFRLGVDQIDAAARMARSLARWRGAERTDVGDLLTGARLQSQPRLSDVARRIEARYGWDDIVLPPDRITQLREIALQVLHQHVIYEQWGFAPKASLGRGVSALFVGDSGTGKTMAAEVIGSALGLDLYKIDLSGLVSKYIGETEKNLARVFDEAQGANAIRFFDEADAVFGKRTEVRDSHDRYANIEVSYLLQKIEEYDGIVVLSSNLRANLDDAFLRRLKAIIDFPLPDEDDRRRIWELNLTANVPLAADVDLDFLARQFRVSGGNIKNIALLAAFLAAGEESPLAMRHLIRAARREYQKLGRLVTESDFAHWYDEAQR